MGTSIILNYYNKGCAFLLRGNLKGRLAILDYRNRHPMG